MRRVRKNPVKNPKPSTFQCYVMDSKETFQEEILDIIRYTEATVGSIDDKTKQTLINNYRMLIDVHACCLAQSIGEACHIEEPK